jgi:IS30 family transposase
MILAEHSRGSSQRAMGRLLGRPASTICRELARGRQADGSYCPVLERQVYDARRVSCRRQPKLLDGGATYRFVHDHLVHRRWSPEQIAQRLRRMKPNDPSARVSHETIYAAIYAQPRGGMKAAMIDACGRQSPRVAAGARRWRARPWSRNRCAVSNGPRRSQRVWCPVTGKAI